jgi:D-alanyl-D-alanine carboxypeptidase/Hemopexin
MSKLAGFLVPQRGKIYFFYGDRYARYDCTADCVEAGYPKPIAGNWNGAFDRDVQAAALRPAGDYAYLFRGAEYVKIDMVGNALVGGYPKLIKDYWPGLFEDDIDAALPALDNNFTYFFKGGEYVKYDWTADAVVDGYPRSIADNWAGVYASGIETAVGWPDGNAYFFAGGEYVRYDLNTNAPGDGYPRSVDANWTGLSQLTSGAAPAVEKPVAVENPGGGRVTNKNDPAPSDLVTVDGPNNAKVQLHHLAAKFWGQLVEAARADGHASPLLLPVSGYRSSATQKVLFDQAVARYGSEEEARKWVAKPGGSAHQSGRAVDCWLGTSNDSTNVGTQRKTAVWAWLVANAERFGFYPYDAEPWHWEYNPPA